MENLTVDRTCQLYLNFVSSTLLLSAQPYFLDFPVFHLGPVNSGQNPPNLQNSGPTNSLLLPLLTHLFNRNWLITTYGCRLIE